MVDQEDYTNFLVQSGKFILALSDWQSSAARFAVHYSVFEPSDLCANQKNTPIYLLEKTTLKNPIIGDEIEVGTAILRSSWRVWMAT